MPEELSLFESVSLTARKMSEEVFTEPDADWDPIVFFEKKDGEMGPVWPIGQFMESPHSKDVLAEMLLPAVILELKAVRVVMVLSTWVAEVKDDEDPYAVPPSEHPNRKEMILISEITKEGVDRYTFADITRHENAPPTLGEWKEIEGAAGFDGRFVDPVVRALKKVAA